MQASGSCCRSRRRATSAGHYACFKLLTPFGPENRADKGLFELLSLALWHGHTAFASRLFEEQRMDAPWFAAFCLHDDDAVSLQFAIRAAPGVDIGELCRHAALSRSVGCLRLLLESGAPWGPYSLLFATKENRLDILELVLPLTTAWCLKVPTAAACLGHVRFLMRIFDAGSPIWTCASDGDTQEVIQALKIPTFFSVGGPMHPIPDSCLMVSSDLACSGPVLLYAAQKGVALTPRMEGMLGDVRRRALALAGCFHRAAALSGKAGASARKWDAMGRVPVDLIERIATLAKISIVAADLIQ